MKEVIIMRIEYFRKDSYGNTHYYIKDKVIASQIKSLLGKPTITKPEMDTITHLFKVEFVQALTPEEEMPF